ncbi:hypothetical protein OAR92_01655 [Porticoccaceae bacterium]|nr:hypothetical protein [Porticoccaceae bacterium]
MKNLLLALLLISPVSFADFNCEVKDMKRLSDDGSLTTPPNPWQVGSVFVVNRMSGEVSGKSAPMLDMTVLSLGNDDNAWKGVSKNRLDRVLDPSFASLGPLNGNGTELDSLWISLYLDGPDKPFIYYEATSVLTGVCKVF